MTNQGTIRTVGALACTAMLATAMGSAQQAQAPPAAVSRFPDLAGMWNGLPEQYVSNRVWWFKVGLVSLAAWFAVLYCGRMLAFIGDAF